MYADIAVLTVTTLFIATAMRMGAERIFIGEVSATGGPGSLAGRRRGGNLLGTSMLVALVVAVAICTPPVRSAISQPLSSALSSPEVIGVAVWVGFDIVRFVAAEANRSAYRVGWAAWGGVGVRQPLFLAIVVAWSIAAGSNLTRSQVILAAAVSSVATALPVIARLGSQFPWWSARPIASLRAMWRGHASMVLTTVAALLINSADLWILGHVATTEQIASYAFAVNLVAGLALFNSGLASALAPYIADNLRRGTIATLQRLVVTQVRRAGAAATIAYLGVIVLAQPIAVRLGGDDYLGVTVLVALLGFGQLVGVLAGPAGQVLTIARSYRLVTIVTLAVSATAVVLELGAAMAPNKVVVVALVSGLATGSLHLVSNFVLRRVRGMNTWAWAHRPSVEAIKGEDQLADG